jgi:hypothetical protein
MKQATRVPYILFILINGTLMHVSVNNRFPSAPDGDDDDAEKPLQK